MKFNKNSFTYGVEIEGGFTTELLDSLDDSFNVQRKSDGSVDLKREDYRLADMGLVANGVSEISVGVFYNQEDLMKCLKMVDVKSHFQNNTCGLHLHLKPKTKVADLKNAIANFSFIEKLQNYGFSHLCKCVKARKNVHYCESYHEKFIRNDWRRQTKYRFVRNHPSGTFEFRFLAPCKHKVENVQKFLKYFFEELKKVNSVFRSVVEFNTFLLEKQLYSYKIEVPKEKTSYKKYEVENIARAKRESGADVRRRLVGRRGRDRVIKTYEQLLRSRGVRF